MQREAGHATENLLLEATARLAAVPVGGIDASAVASMLALPPGTVVLYVIPIGYEINGAG